MKDMMSICAGPFFIEKLLFKKEKPDPK